MRVLDIFAPRESVQEDEVAQAQPEPAKPETPNVTYEFVGLFVVTNVNVEISPPVTVVPVNLP